MDNYPSKLAAAAALSLLVLAVLVSYFDRLLFSLLVTPIKSAMTLSDARIGILQGGAVGLWLGLASLPLGYLVDRANRVRIIAASALIWSVFTILTGFCQNFPELFFCRMGVGIAEAGVVPAAYSLIGDLYPARSRPTANFVYFWLVLLGSSFSIVLGGAAIDFIGKHYKGLGFGIGLISTWRLAFALSGLPGIALSALMLSVTEPTRKGRAPSGEVPCADIPLGTFARRNPFVFTRICTALTLSGICVGSLLMWMPTILARQYHLSPSNMGKWLGTAYGVGSLSGVVLAGLLTRMMLSKTNELTLLKVVRIGAAIAAAILPAVVFFPSRIEVFAIVLLFTAFSYVVIATGPALLTTLTPNHLRGRIFAVELVMIAFSSFISATLIGWMSDKLFHGPSGLLTAFCAANIPCAIGSAALLLGSPKALPVTSRIPA